MPPFEADSSSNWPVRPENSSEYLIQIEAVKQALASGDDLTLAVVPTWLARGLTKSDQARCSKARLYLQMAEILNNASKANDEHTLIHWGTGKWFADTNLISPLVKDKVVLALQHRDALDKLRLAIKQNDDRATLSIWENSSLSGSNLVLAGDKAAVAAAQQKLFSIRSSRTVKSDPVQAWLSGEESQVSEQPTEEQLCQYGYQCRVEEAIKQGDKASLKYLCQEEWQPYYRKLELDLQKSIQMVL